MALLALRLALLDETMAMDAIEATIAYTSPVPLFATGAEAAAHGVTNGGASDPRATMSCCASLVPGGAAPDLAADKAAAP